MIGVVGTDAAKVAEPLRDRGLAAEATDPGTAVTADLEAVVAVGEAAVGDLARAGVDAPVVPVDADPGFPASREGAFDALDRVLDGDGDPARLPVLSARVDGAVAGRAVFDVTLVTAEPGRISEYGVVSGAPVDRFRADGVVAATPVGSRGYARAAGGPVLARGVDAVAVVPIAAFAIRADTRVLDPPVALSVERDEAEVSLFVDGRERGRVPPDRPVRVSADGRIGVAVPGRP